MSDPLSSFDFDQVSKPGLFLKFQAGKPVTLRVLTTDPVLQQQEFEDKVTGEVTLTTKFNFIIYNFTDNRAQVWGATSAMGRKIGELHNDPDFGANIRKTDIKITPTGEKKERRYNIQVLRHSGNETQLSAEQVKEAQSINLDDLVEDGSRMSIWKKPQEQRLPTATHDNPPSRDWDKLGKHEDDQAVDTYQNIAENDIGEEPIDLNDIPF